MPALAARPLDGAAQDASRFDPVSMAFHWATVLVMVWMFASAWSIGLAGDAAGAARMLTLHRSMGVILWVLVLTRLTWRLGFARRPPLPADLPAVQRLAASLNEGALYALLLVQPLTGLTQSLARGKPFVLLGVEVPKLMARDRGLVGLVHEIHELTAWALLGLIGLHLSAALFHGLVRRDGVLASMWPARPR